MPEPPASKQPSRFSVFIQLVRCHLAKSHLLVTTALYVLLARCLHRPNFANFALSWPASELSPLLVLLQAANLVGTELLSPGILVSDPTTQFASLLNAVSMCVFARAAWYNLASRQVFSAALEAQVRTKMDSSPLWLHLAAVVPLWVVASRGCSLRRRNNIAYADWALVDPQLRADWASAALGFKRLNTWLGRGVARHWLSLDVLSPPLPVPRDAPVFMYIHGGGWGIGDKLFAGHAILARLASRGVVCVAVNYRLAPDAAFPAQILDCMRALRWIKDHALELGGDKDKIFVCGESAGGHLSALLATAGPAHFCPPESSPHADWALAGCIPLYGVFDLLDESGAQSRLYPALIEGLPNGMLPFVERLLLQKPYTPDSARDFQLASPLFHLRQNETNPTFSLPPMLIVHGDADQLVPHDGSSEFFAQVRAFRLLRGQAAVPDVFVSLPDAPHQFGYLVSPRGLALADCIWTWMQRCSR